MYSLSMHRVAVRDDTFAMSHLDCELAFKVQISKIWIFHIVTGSLIVKILTITINIKSCTLSVQR